MPQNADAYRGMARHYDLHGWDWYAPTFGSRLLALLEEQGVPAGASVLDAGCGTGSLALLLAGRGYSVTGVDLSSAMIARARAKDAGSDVDWRVGDLASLELGRTFDAIVSVADVFNHLPSLDDWEASLRRLQSHLVPGGLLFLDAMTCRGLARMDQQSVQERDGITLILAIVWEPDARRSTLKVTSFAPASGSPHFERVSETIVEWGQPAEQVIERIRRAGFREPTRVWAGAENAEDDERLTLIARVK